MSKIKSKFVCNECGYETPKWMGKCPGCHAWNTMTEHVERTGKRRGGLGGRSAAIPVQEKPRPIHEIESASDPRIRTKIGELDRVLGGGIVPGSLTLVGGDPGIGKSTLLLQTSHSLRSRDSKCCTYPVRSRRDRPSCGRTGWAISSPNLYVLCETDLELMQASIDELKPDLLIVDSIQTVYLPQLESAPGSVCAGTRMYKSLYAHR